ncbi:PH domain-containing protein [Rhizocola hellebori]|uniref:PH domain-containing protein n=1 Tax=Rhizocola hellebori TaxID=1392758 RepID=UPI0035714D69
MWGIWRTLRLGVRIDDNGVRIRSQIDSRQRLIPWSQVKSVECAAVDARASMTIS